MQSVFFGGEDKGIGFGMEITIDNHITQSSPISLTKTPERCISQDILLSPLRCARANALLVDYDLPTGLRCLFELKIAY